MQFSRRQAVAALAGAGMLPARALAGDRPPFVNRIVLEDGRVWIAAKIGDKGPFFFVIDTGGYVSLIDDAFAKQMGMEKVTSRQSVGIGGVSDHSWYDAGTVTLASGIRFPHMLFAGMRARPSKDAVGSFGAGLFTTYDSDLDFVKGEWRAYPDGRPDFAGLTRLKARFGDYSGGQRISAKAVVEGFEGDFLLDTGSPGEVALYGRAAGKSGLWDDSRPYAPSAAKGIGKNEVPGRLVRAAKLQIGPFTFDRPIVRLSQPGTPSGENEGIIGIGVLGRLHLSTDVSQQAIYAAPNGLPAPRASYPLSGLWLDEDDGRITIVDVGTGSPAALAGLRKGDVLKERSLGAAIARIDGGPGKPVSLEIERGGAAQTIAYTLKPWL